MSDDATTNPYVGPRTFQEEERELFFGRNREAKDLVSLVKSERLVLFYAQSGAGKSSLLNTRLRPNLQEVGFEILPTGRVSGTLPPGISQAPNIFSFNLILKLDQNRSEAAKFSQTSLHDYLRQPPVEPGQATPIARLLIVDQFEEIFTTNQEYWPQRAGFFQQLAEAMDHDPRLWVLLVMREDYIANLDPYAHLLPGKLLTRYYMQRLSRKAALEAISKPAQKRGRPFAPGVAETLVDNLRQIRKQGQESEIHLGEFVEPVQLQVVCYQLWEKLKVRPPAEITEEDVRELGDVDAALVQFYEQALAEAVQQTGVPEIELRDWFERELITEAGTRGVVYQGKEQTGGLANKIVHFLAAKFLLRADVRIEGTWYELIHDRLVGPILKANLAWRLKQPLLQLAQEWLDSGRNTGKLLVDQQLAEALASNWKGLGAIVGEFLEASQAAQQAREAALQAEKQAQLQHELEITRRLAEEAQARHEAESQRAQEAAQSATKLRRGAIIIGVIGAVALIMAITAFIFGLQAETAREVAVTAQVNAGYSEATAIFEAVARATEVAVRSTAEAEAAYSEATAISEAEARSTEIVVRITAEAEAAIAAATAEAARAAAETALAEQVTNLQDILSGESANKATLEAQLAIAEARQTAISLQKLPVATPTEPLRPTPTVGSPPTRTSTPRSAAVTFPPSGRIVFVSNRDGQAEAGNLYLMNADGSNPTRLTFNLGTEPEPDYSLMTNRVVFTRRGANGIVSLYVLNLDNKETTSLDRRFWDNWDPTFAPDGERIAFVSSRNNRGWEIYSIRIGVPDPDDLLPIYGDPSTDSSQCPELSTELDKWAPAWSPDGRQIAFVAQPDAKAIGEYEGQADIWIINVDGTDCKPLTNDGAMNKRPAWSPDGQQLAFASNRDGGFEIYLMNADGSNQRKLPNSPINANYPAWSPDGKWLAFSRFEPYDIIVMTIDGSFQKNLTDGTTESWSPIWLP